MSSRTAAGRKRIRQEPKEHKEHKDSPLKGLFSRSKSVAPPPKVSSPVPSHPSVPTPIPPAQPQYVSTNQDYPSTGLRISRSETPSGVQSLQGYRSPSSRNPPSPLLSAASGAYPSPDTHYRALPQQQAQVRGRRYEEYGASPLLKKAASTSNMLTAVQDQQYISDGFPQPPPHIFLEASYQPPPPTQPRNGRPLPHNPVTGQPMSASPYPPEKMPSPATPYPPIIPSPPRSPAPPPFSGHYASPTPRPGGINASLLLQPPPASRGAGSSFNGVAANEVAYTAARPRLQVATAASTTPTWQGNYGAMSDRGNQTVWPSPPPERDVGLAYLDDSVSPVTPRQFGEESSANANRRGMTFTGFEPVSPGNESIAPSTDAQASTYSTPGYSSSRRSSVSSGSQDKSSPTFVFPGSRSTVKPKISSTTGKTRLNIMGKKGKTQGGKGKYPEFEALPISLAPTSPPSRPTTSLARSEYSSSSSSKGDQSHVMPKLGDEINRARKMSTATANTSTTSGSSSSGRSNPGFVYPGGRSRAHPSATPLTMPSIKFSRKGKSSRNSGVSSGSDNASRKRFMGIPLGKKKSAGEFVRPPTPPSPMAFTLMNKSERSEEDTTYEGSQIGSTTSNGGPVGPEFEAYKAQRLSPEVRRQERVQRIKSRIGAYPLDPYDSILLDNDRHTGDLLNRLNGTGCPSFYEYGSDPPATVLDLGCGQGHWVVEAAIAWKGHGTKVTGYDMVDISKVLLPWAIKQGVADNIRFVRGNFLKQRLPFNDNSFDLVRMSSLALCITADAWIFVFQEVCRVLTLGGRLEFIDDSILFPYGKPPLASVGGLPTPSTPQLNMFAPQLDINIPTSAFSTFCIYDDSEHPNPGLGLPDEDDEEDQDDILELYQVKEEGESDADDTATLNGKEPEARFERPSFQRDPRARSLSRPRNRSRATQTSSRLRTWNRHAATSNDLESLFEHMLTHKFGIHMRPEEFVLELMMDVFGHAREVTTMHLSLAPPEVAVEEDRPRGRPLDDSTKSHDRYGSFSSHLTHIPSPSPARTVGSARHVGTPLSRSPGLVLSPSTFIPMTQQELEIHASKHLRLLLSCKKFLVEHAMEATEDEEIDEDSVLEALWEYEGFLRARFNHPPDYRRRDKSPSLSDSASTRESILSISSEGQDAVWEYQSEFRQRFAWPLDGPESPTASRSQITPKIASSNSNSSSSIQIMSTPQEQPPTLPGPPLDHLARPPSPGVIGTPQGQPPIPAGPPPGHRPPSPVGAVAPPYSRGEMTHVRTFRVYEAIKLDETLLGSST